MTKRIEIGDGWIDVSETLHSQVMDFAMNNDVTPAKAYDEVLGLDVSGAAFGDEDEAEDDSE